ncbi:MAG TPA: hypothetical protein VFX15_05060 [Actinomycetes bacterium]|nr:hypothetical protein [Actinomycetes bacterium]
MPALKVRRIWGITALTALLTVGLTAPLVIGPAQAAGGKKGDFSVSISPQQTQVGSTDSYRIEVANARSSSNSIGSVQVVVPAAFTDVSLGAVTTPAGFVARIASCSSDSPPGCGAPGSTLIEVATPNVSGATKVEPGKSLIFAVSAKAQTKGTFTWATEAKNSAAWSTGQVLNQSGADPTVEVRGAAAKLAFSSPPPTTVTAGDTFGVSVAVQDEDGNSVQSTAEITLSATGLRGDKVVTASNGVATFTGLSLVRAGDISLTASSAGLASASADVTVRPGPPAAIDVVAPTCPAANPDCGVEGDRVPAGTQFAAAVSINDRFDNVVDTPQSVTVTRSATPSEPAATITKSATNGNVEVVLGAPGSLGSYHYVVTSGSLTPVAFDVTVEAGAAVAVTIDAVTPQTGAVLAKDQPFDVTLTTRDAFGNPTPFTGTVTLSTSGGVGPALGTLTAPAATFDGTSTATAVGAVYDGYGNSITLHAESSALIDGSRLIDINLFATVKSGTPGQALTVALGDCQDATPAVPVCSRLILNNGAVGNVTVAQGECDPFTPCRRGPVNEALLFDGRADLTDGNRALYTRKNPAIIQLRCDKTLCGGAGTNGFPLLFQETGWAPTQFEEAPPCPRKGQIGPNQSFCQDYRQNNRDNAGDLVAYLLFLDDAKATFR